MRRIGTWLAFVLIGVSCAGCGDRGKATVTGMVTFDGDPVARGGIEFEPRDGETASAGASIKDGTFTAAVPPGIKKVRITSAKVVGQVPRYDTGDSPMRSITEERLPARYNTATELELEVKPGLNKVEYKLTSK
jgi:hypothetical protein